MSVRGNGKLLPTPFQPRITWNKVIERSGFLGNWSDPCGLPDVAFGILSEFLWPPSFQACSPPLAFFQSRTDLFCFPDNWLGWGNFGGEGWTSVIPITSRIILICSCILTLGTLADARSVYSLGLMRSQWRDCCALGCKPVFFMVQFIIGQGDFFLWKISSLAISTQGTGARPLKGKKSSFLLCWKQVSMVEI